MTQQERHILLTLTLFAVAVVVPVTSDTSHAGPLELTSDLNCTLRKSAALFTDQTARNRSATLDAGTQLRVVDIPGRVARITLQDGRTGFIKAKRLRKVCILSAPPPEATVETSSSRPDTKVELCKLSKSAALFADQRLKARKGKARRGDTYRVITKTPRVWEIQEWREDQGSDKDTTPSLTTLFAKTRRLKKACMLETRIIEPPSEAPEALAALTDDRPDTPDAARDETQPQATELPVQEPSTTAVPVADASAPNSTAREPNVTAASDSVPPSPTDIKGQTESLEQVDLMGDRYWIDRERKVAVRDVTLTNASLPPLVAESLSSVIAAELQYRSRGRFQVISRGDLRNIIAQQTEAQMMGCTSDSCMMDLAEIAEADNVLTSSVERLGESTILTLELFDTELQRVMRRQAVAWRGDDAGLVDLARSYLTWIVEGSRAADLRGSLQVVADQDNAKTIINGKEMGRTPLTLLPDLPIGLHELRLDKAGYLPHDQPFVIQANETTLVQLSLIDESSLIPWYRSWWTWSGAALLVGGATSALLLNQGLGAEQPLCLSACIQDPWYTNTWTVAGLALGALSLGASAYIAWNWDDLLQTWVEFISDDDANVPTKPDPREDIITAGYRSER